jgi:guanine deaminase
MDVVVLDDTRLAHPQTLTVKERLERMIYFSDDREIIAKYVQGRKLF